MLRTIAYLIFVCTGFFALVLIFLFFRDSRQAGTQSSIFTNNSSTVQVETASKVLERLNKNYAFRKSSQKDIFGAFIFTFPVESKVAGALRIYIFQNDYALIRKNLSLLSEMYTFQDTKDFFGKTMFLNDKSGNGQIVRFITEIEGRTYGFEVLRDEYRELKSLILQ